MKNWWSLSPTTLFYGVFSLLAADFKALFIFTYSVTVIVVILSGNLKGKSEVVACEYTQIGGFQEPWST